MPVGQFNSSTEPATISEQPTNITIGHGLDGWSYRPCARRCAINAVSYSSEVENMQAKPPRANVAAASSELRAARDLELRGGFITPNDMDRMVNAGYPPVPSNLCEARNTRPLRRWTLGARGL